jgi:UDP-N-acetylglucosamine--N-acetylmuramyl-(pentapeptide) pyrophosphoryl-undecaprenol N-acetylglucosamine transferase
VDVLFAGGTGPEGALARERGFEFAAVPSAKGSRSVGGMVRAAVPLARGFLRAVRVIARTKPDVVVGMGSYAAFAMVQAAVLARTPTLIHEQNSVPGRANRFLGKQVRCVALTFADAEPYFPAGRCAITGLPTRPGIGAADRAEARRQLGLRPDGPALLVLGGSQGARSLNQAVAAGLSRWLEAGVQVLHLTGPSHLDAAVAAAGSAVGNGYRALAYCERMELAYAAVDLVLCRAGASTLAELALCGLPALLVPYPYAADDHQRANASAFVRAGAARLLTDADVAAGAATSQVLELVANPELMASMGTSAKSLARPNAAEALADLVCKLSVDSGRATPRTRRS